MAQGEIYPGQVHGIKEIREAHEKIKTALHEITTQMQIILTILNKETKPPQAPNNN